MKRIKVFDLTKIAAIAALYAALTLLSSPISYNNIQFRFAEILMLLVLYQKKYGISLIIGCLIANFFSPLGWPDIVFGTLATALSVLGMMLIKNKYISSLIPVILNGVIVGLELYFVLDLPFWISALEVAAGEFVVVSVIGVQVMRLLERSPVFKKYIMEIEEDKE